MAKKIKQEMIDEGLTEILSKMVMIIVWKIGGKWQNTRFGDWLMYNDHYELWSQDLVVYFDGFLKGEGESKPEFDFEGIDLQDFEGREDISARAEQI